MEYEKPDWTMAALEIGTMDLGWAEGSLPDGRPYLLERWQDDGNQLATVYFSPRNIADQSTEALVRLLSEAGILGVDVDPLPSDAGLVRDAGGQMILAVNVVLSDPLENYAHVRVPIIPYPTEESMLSQSPD